MKKTSLLLAVVGLVLITSCGKDDSLEGTTWKSRVEYNGNWSEDIFIFSSTGVTYYRTSDSGTNDRTFTGTYTYDPPRVVIDQETLGFDDQPIVLQHEGTVSRKTLTIGIHETLDVVAITELTKQ